MHESKAKTLIPVTNGRIFSKRKKSPRFINRDVENNNKQFKGIMPPVGTPKKLQMFVQMRKKTDNDIIFARLFPTKGFGIVKVPHGGLWTCPFIVAFLTGVLFVFQVHLKANFIMNGVCVKWRGWIDLERLDGVGCIEYCEERAAQEDAILREQIQRYNDRLREFEDKQRGYRQHQERAENDLEVRVGGHLHQRGSYMKLY